MVTSTPQLTKIRKRNGEVSEFNSDKIKVAIIKAFASVGNHDYQLIDRLVGDVLNVITNKFDADNVPTVEQVQDVVEIILMHNNLPQIAKNYILYRQQRANARERQKQILDGLTTSLPYSDNALKVLAKRYLQKDAGYNKIIETPEQMLERVSKTLAEVERRYGKDDAAIEQFSTEFYEIMSRFEFTPAGRTMTNAGTDLPIVANCIVLGINDTMEDIFDTLKDAALLQQAGSGLGFPFHLLRPAGEKTRRSRGVSSGPISFLRVYNEAFSVIKQQNRHGANMAIMNVEHPDILEFVHCKEREGDIKNFNISVGLTDRFMEAVANDDPRPWKARFKDKEYNPRRIYRDQHQTIVDIVEETMTARELFQEVITAAWSNGEPGCVFLDTVNKVNPLPGLGRIEASNPCGEQFLHDGDVCNLGSINLEKFAENGQILWDRLAHVTRHAVRMLDNVVDITEYASAKVNKVSKNNRRVGLGIMGFADMLYKLEIGYNSKEGFDTAEKVMAFIQKHSHEMSQELAEEKGLFNNYDKSVYIERGIKMRNAALTNIAPTGTIAMMYDISGGVEPYFALAYHYKNVLGGDVQLTYVNKHLERALKAAGCWSEAIKDEIVRSGTLQHIPEIPEHVKKVFVTSMDITAEDHIMMQAAFQKHCDNAISKTVNFPYSATKEDVLQGYLLAWKMGCKGCTVYRDGSREYQVLNLNKDDASKKEEPNPNAGITDEMPMNDGPKVSTGGGTEVVERAEAPQSYSHAEPVVMTETVTVASVLNNSSVTSTTIMGKKEVIVSGKCPECGSGLSISEGCYTCLSCGVSACSI
ncbi:MAG: adenosylcobalamin-dependent ribonucleoside-diphosphate reductase [Candidatus Buchananbacteria bacterium]|nr:adenosylcobalamin-dependent ribonucleoside-diphosphate reductase [Candidatus Buchananbacteria bacterium]